MKQTTPPPKKKKKKKEIKKKHYNKLFGKLMLTDAFKIRIFYWWQSAQPHRKICAVLRAFTVHTECETKTWINHLYQHWL